MEGVKIFTLVKAFIDLISSELILEFQDEIPAVKDIITYDKYMGLSFIVNKVEGNSTTCSVIHNGNAKMSAGFLKPGIKYFVLTGTTSEFAVQ